MFLSSESIPGHLELKTRLSAHLAIGGHGPGADRSPDPSDTIIYVLGGSEKSLVARLGTAARLYRAGRARQILFCAAPGITRFEPALGRNLTNAEWVLRQLQTLGVAPDRADQLAVQQPAWFGTRSEADALAHRTGELGCRTVILVTSAFHGARTWRTFTDAFKGRPGTALVLSLSEERATLGQLLFEYGKLLFYTIALLPRSAP